MIQAREDPAQVADPVAVGVRERARIDLVQHAVAPPRRARARSWPWRAAYASGGLTRAATMEPLPWSSGGGRRGEEDDDRAGRRRSRSRRRHGVPRPQRLAVGERRHAHAGCSRRSTRSTTSRAPPHARCRPAARTPIGVVAPFFTQPSVIERLRGVSPRSPARLPADADRRGAPRPAARHVPAARGARAHRRPARRSRSRRPTREARAAAGRRRRSCWSTATHATLPAITIDDFEGGRIAAEHLLGARPPRGSASSATRRRTRSGSTRARTGARASRRPAPPRAPRSRRTGSCAARTAASAARAAARELLAQATPPTRGLRRLRRPGDRGARGGRGGGRAGARASCRSSASTTWRPPRYAGLTTVAQPLEESGALGADLLLRRAPARRLAAPPDAAARSSSAARPPALGLAEPRSEGYQVRRRHDGMMRTHERGGSSVRGRYVVMLAARCSHGRLVVAACGGDDEGGGGGSVPARRRPEPPRARRSSTSRSMDERQGRRHLLQGQGHLRRRRRSRSSSSTRSRATASRSSSRVPESAGRAAQPVHPAPGGQVRRVRHLLRRRGLDGGVRVAEVALGHDAVRRGAQGRVHPGDVRDGHLRRQELGRPEAVRRGASSTTAPTRSRKSPTTWQEVYEDRGRERRHRLPGRGVRGPDLRLPRDRVRRRRQGALRGRQEGRVRLAGEPQGAAVHGRRHQGRRGAEGRDDLHGGGGARAPSRPARATFMRNWPYAYAHRQEDTRTRRSSRSRRSPSSRAAARPASSAATTS